MFRIKFKKVIGTREILALLLISVFITSVLVFTLGHKAIITEIQIVIGIISLVLFAFLFFGLYSGFRLKKEKIKPVKIEYKQMDLSGCDSCDCSLCDCDSCDCGGDDIIEAIIAALAWLFITIISLILLSIMLPLLWGIFISLCGLIYWLFYRAMRNVFIKARKCRGNIINSLIYSSMYAVLYSGWLFVVISLVKTIR